jgi:hypothetical protein
MAIFTNTTDGFFVAWGFGETDPDTTQPENVHYGPYEANQPIYSGQPRCEFFDTEEEAKAKVESLGHVYEYPEINPFG